VALGSSNHVIGRLRICGRHSLLCRVGLVFIAGRCLENRGGRLVAARCDFSICLFLGTGNGCSCRSGLCRRFGQLCGGNVEEGKALLVRRVDGVLDFIKGRFDGLELSPGKL
jgi:hypothetical protein